MKCASKPLKEMKCASKPLKEMKCASKPTIRILLKMHFSTIFARRLHIFLRVFSNFRVSAKAYLGPLPHQEWSSL